MGLDAVNFCEIDYTVKAGMGNTGNALRPKFFFEIGIFETGISPLACPECSGVLVRIREGTMERYRCHTGHSFIAPSLSASIHESEKNNLWKVLQNLEELVMLFGQNAKNSENKGNPPFAEVLYEKAVRARQKTVRLRRFFLNEKLYTDNCGQEREKTTIPRNGLFKNKQPFLTDYA